MGYVRIFARAVSNPGPPNYSFDDINTMPFTTLLFAQIEEPQLSVFASWSGKDIVSMSSDASAQLETKTQEGRIAVSELHSRSDPHTESRLA